MRDDQGGGDRLGAAGLDRCDQGGQPGGVRGEQGLQRGEVEVVAERDGVGDGVRREQLQRDGDVAERQVEVDEADLATAAVGQRGGQVGGQRRLAAAALGREDRDDPPSRPAVARPPDPRRGRASPRRRRCCAARRRSGRTGRARRPPRAPRTAAPRRARRCRCAAGPGRRRGWAGSPASPRPAGGRRPGRSRGRGRRWSSPGIGVQVLAQIVEGVEQLRVADGAAQGSRRRRVEVADRGHGAAEVNSSWLPVTWFGCGTASAPFSASHS